MKNTHGHLKKIVCKENVFNATNSFTGNKSSGEYFMRSNSDTLINTRTNQLISNLFDDSGTMVNTNITNKQKTLEKKQYKLNAIPAYERTARIERVA